MRCRVRGCRFAWSHVAFAHKCGRCGEYGHGRLECNDADAISALARHAANDSMPHNRRCEVTGCWCAWSHSTLAHDDRRVRVESDVSPIVSSSAAPPDPTAFAEVADTWPSVHASPDRTESGVILPIIESAFTPNAAHRIILRTCPHCKVTGAVDVAVAYYTGSDCTVCFESKPCVAFFACRHANVCAECVERLS